MVEFDVPEPDYDRYTNRQLLAVPLITLTIALLIIGGFWVVTGSPAHLGIDFAGGTELTVDTADDEDEIREAFDTEIDSIQDVQQPSDRYIITFSEGDDLSSVANESLTPVDDDSEVVVGEQTISPLFAAEMQMQALLALAIAFVGMSILAFVFFRTFVPSVAIVASAFSDMVIPLAMMNLLGIELTLGTVAALLMLIGYSVDSDILLNNHILRRRGDFYESTYSAMQTGVTMTVTSMVAMATMTIVATFFGIGLLQSVGLILFIGLAADLMNTYLMNLSMLRWYKFEGVKR